jgi:hypothetical protein
MLNHLRLGKSMIALSVDWTLVLTIVGLGMLSVIALRLVALDAQNRTRARTTSLLAAFRARGSNSRQAGDS